MLSTTPPPASISDRLAALFPSCPVCLCIGPLVPYWADDRTRGKGETKCETGTRKGRFCDSQHVAVHWHVLIARFSLSVSAQSSMVETKRTLSRAWASFSFQCTDRLLSNTNLTPPARRNNCKWAVVRHQPFHETRGSQGQSRVSQSQGTCIPAHVIHAIDNVCRTHVDYHPRHPRHPRRRPFLSTDISHLLPCATRTTQQTTEKGLQKQKKKGPSKDMNRDNVFQRTAAETPET